ncbi:nucleotidyltransferase family protein [Paenibacillus hexagrammi]|uniref:Nucleotidyltransferase family protein n=1 Tax=Paenibacillus hexagrammi TaxID=2908839 RepID=A0ABY3SQB2_9BACL|nr:hypothetical protein [Paenibacillus sp. YPD9-1]UJF36198.1 hypothetical protein L0M14_14735 [Paenibacillus sp. YPD9-1]
MLLNEPLLSGIQKMQELLEPHRTKWVLGGSCGLLLHDVKLDRSPRDIDIYVDENAVGTVYEAMRTYATDHPEYSETPIYASILSHYQLMDCTIEAVGAFRVHALESSYQVEAGYLWDQYSFHTEVGNRKLRVMPLAHELLFNLLRCRADRYERIAEVMRQAPETHYPALKALLARNNWSAPVLKHIEELLQLR